jgi:Arc/MetJ family transcription regulator
VKKRTNILLDIDLVREASTALGTHRTTDTVHAALREAIAQHRRRRLAGRELPGLTLEGVEEMRRGRATM